MTQKMSHIPIHGAPTTIAMFSHARPKAIMPQKLSIQYTRNVPCPYDTGLRYAMSVTCVVEVMGFVCVKLIWKAIETNEYARERKM